jgi:hypothetical protein
MKPEGFVHLAFIFDFHPLETPKPLPNYWFVDAMLGPQT